MTWRIEYTGSARRSIRRLDPQVQRRLRDFLENRLAHLDNPRQLGTTLQGTPYQNLWRYRVGNYRIITEIDDDSIRILVVRIAHRREAYR